MGHQGLPSACRPGLEEARKNAGSWQGPLSGLCFELWRNKFPLFEAIQFVFAVLLFYSLCFVIKNDFSFLNNNYNKQKHYRVLSEQHIW